VDDAGVAESLIFVVVEVAAVLSVRSFSFLVSERRLAPTGLVVSPGCTGAPATSVSTGNPDNPLTAH
jgi:hypothetical protein